MCRSRAQTAATSESASNIDGGEGGGDRKGVYLVVKATGVKVIGEKGTKVPYMSIKDLHIMVDCALEASFEFTEADLWQPTAVRVLEYLLNLWFSHAENNAKLRFLHSYESSVYVASYYWITHRLSVV